MFFNRRRTGDIFARFQENMKVRSFLTESTISTLLNVLMAFIYFTVMFMYSVKLTLLLIAFLVPHRRAHGPGDAAPQAVRAQELSRPRRTPSHC